MIPLAVSGSSIRAAGAMPPAISGCPRGGVRSALKVVIWTRGRSSDWIPAFGRRDGHRASLERVPIDFTGERLVDLVRRQAPDLIGLSLTSRQWLRARSLLADLRRSTDTPVIVGGLHPTFAGEEVLRHSG